MVNKPSHQLNSLRNDDLLITFEKSYLFDVCFIFQKRKTSLFLVRQEITSNCGSQTHPCRTISQAVAHASSGDCFHLDRTDTNSQPYTCDPLTSRYPGIYISDSLTLAGFPNMAHIKCSFEGRLFINGTEKTVAPTIRLKHISFDNSTLQIDDFNAEIENCTFTRNIFHGCAI